MEDPSTHLDAATGRLLARWARCCAAEALSGSDTPRTDPPPVTGRCGGAFVSFHHEGRLRGCVGTFCNSDDIPGLIRHAAASATSDARFAGDPVTSAELPLLEVEVSVLSPMTRLQRLDDFVVGHHGIVVRGADHSGCFLPRVAVDRGWDVRRLLEECCQRKAGLGRDAWMNDDCRIMTFTAQVFVDPPERLARTR